MGTSIALARVLRRCGSGADTENVEARVSFGTILVIVLSIVGGVALLALGVVTGKEFDFVVQLLGGISSLYGALAVMAALCVVFLGAQSLVRSLFMSSDNEVLLALPFTALDIALARVIGSVRLPLAISTLVLLPFCLGYGFGATQGPGYCLAVVLGAVCTPAVALASVVIALVLLVRFVPPARNRELLSTLLVAIPTVLTFAIVFIPSSSITAESAETAANILSGVASFFPLTAFLNAMMLGENVALNAVAVLAITAAIVALMVLACKYLYLPALLAMNDGGSSAKAVDDESVREGSSASKPVRALMRRDLRELRRTPAYKINCFLITLLMVPLMVVVIMLSGSGELIMQLDLQGELNTFVLCGCFAILSLLVACCIAGNSIAPTCLSREGHTFEVLQTMPLSAHDIACAKRDSALCVIEIGTTGWIFVFLIAFCLMCNVPLWLVAVGTAYTFLLTWALVNIQAALGLRKPNLNWENESEAIRNGVGASALLSIAIGIVLAILQAGVILIIIFTLDSVPLIPAWALALIFVALMAAFAWASDKLMFRYAEKRLVQLQR